MRTTVTLEPEVERLLRDAMHRGRQSFKEALNTALRQGLTARQTTMVGARKQFQVKGPFLGGLQPGIDPTSFNKLASDLEDEEIIRKMRRPDKR